jgi:hypothetical protein
VKRSSGAVLIAPRSLLSCIVFTPHKTHDESTRPDGVLPAQLAGLAAFGILRHGHVIAELIGTGALPCSAVLELIDAASGSDPVLTGPLHFLAYWSVQMQGAFWKHLAGFTHGPGIIVIDTPREEMVEGPFRFLGKIPGTEVRYLKSRLASTQDGLV